MRTRIFTLLALAAIVLSTNNANATIRRVGYWGTPRVNVDYSDLQSAHDAAAAGDTILMFPGSWGATYSKKLVTIGYGYFVDTAGLGTAANFGLQNITGAMSISITLAAGSSNCQFEGLNGFTIHGDGSGATLSNITIRRCYSSNYIDFEYNNIYSNWQILQCYINTIYLYYSGTISNLVVNNCSINYLAGSGGTASNQSGQFNNCVFGIDGYSVDFNNGSFIIKNCIFFYGHSTDGSCVYQNNLFNTSYGAVPAGTGNIGVDATVMNSNVFVGYNVQGSYSYDARLALLAGSPAKGTGSGGTDMGIFGGTNPYKLSGMPRIPAIYKLTAPSNITSGNPYTITLSVRSNN